MACHGSRPSPRPRVGLHLFFISKFPDNQGIKLSSLGYTTYVIFNNYLLDLRIGSVQFNIYSISKCMPNI